MKKILILLLLLCSTSFAGELTIVGTTDMEDAVLDSGSAANYNYGGSTSRQMPINDCYIFRTVGLADLIGTGQQIDACTLLIHQYSSNNTDTYDSARVYRVFKPWVEGTLTGSDPGEGGGVTWNDWAADANEWGVAGAQSASDAGDDNNTDAGGYDRTATPMSANRVGIGYSGVFIPFVIETALAQSWYDGTNDENGVIMRNNFTAGEIVYIYLSEETTNPTLRPYFKVWYSPTTIKMLVKNRP
jgi:hypothetical protein